MHLRSGSLYLFSGLFDPLAIQNVYLGWKMLLTITSLPRCGLGHTTLEAWVLWSIWSVRNQNIFQNRAFSAQETVLKAITDAKEWQQAQPPKEPSQRKIILPPRSPAGGIVCKSDADWKSDRHAAGPAWSVYRNQNEKFISHSLPSAFVISSLVAEGLAIRSAMEHAIFLEMKNMVFESDSLQLVIAIKEGSSFSDLHGIISDIYLLSQFFDSVSFRFCFRERLSFEDNLAKQALNDSVPNSF